MGKRKRVKTSTARKTGCKVRRIHTKRKTLSGKRVKACPPGMKFKKVAKRRMSKNVSKGVSTSSGIKKAKQISVSTKIIGKKASHSKKINRAIRTKLKLEKVKSLLQARTELNLSPTRIANLELRKSELERLLDTQSKDAIPEVRTTREEKIANIRRINQNLQNTRTLLKSKRAIPAELKPLLIAGGINVAGGI